jgi:branched-subunit amino acid permease
MLGVKGNITKLISMLPLASSGFSWVIPAIIGGVVGHFITPKENIPAEF